PASARGRRGADPAPAARAGGAGAERCPDRRARRAPRHDPRRALLDPARRAAEAARASGGMVTEMNEAISRLLGPSEPEVGCDPCFAEIDRYVELELAGADADASIPGLRAHLAGCPACREEHESLRALVAGGAD